MEPANIQIPYFCAVEYLLKRLFHISDSCKVRAIARVAGAGNENMRIAPNEDLTISVTDGTPPVRKIHTRDRRDLDPVEDQIRQSCEPQLPIEPLRIAEDSIGDPPYCVAQLFL